MTNKTTNEILARASSQKLCDVVVIGVLPDGGGLYLDWSGSTVASLSLMLSAAQSEVANAYLDGIKTKEAAE